MARQFTVTMEFSGKPFFTGSLVGCKRFLREDMLWDSVRKSKCDRWNADKITVRNPQTDRQAIIEVVQ